MLVFFFKGGGVMMEQLGRFLSVEGLMLVVAFLTMVMVIVAEFTKWRGLRDEEFDRELARLKSLVDRLKFRALRGQQDEHGKWRQEPEYYEGMLVLEFSIGGLLDPIKGRDIRTIEELRKVFGYNGEYRQFTHSEHYFLSLRNLMKWVDERRFNGARCKYARKVVASLSREEVILLSCFCLIRFPLVSIAKEMKDYVEKYGMLYLLHTEIEIDRQGRGLDFRKHFKESAFVEGGWDRKKHGKWVNKI